jgi:hypothetical protein
LEKAKNNTGHMQPTEFKQFVFLGSKTADLRTRAFSRHDPSMNWILFVVVSRQPAAHPRLIRNLYKTEEGIAASLL